MRIPRLYSQQSLSPNSMITLDENAAAHAARVLRLKKGASIILFDGSGGEYPAKIESIEKKKVTASTEKLCCENHHSPLNIHLGIAVSRGERMDLAIQKSTELGIRHITPLFTERVEVRLQGKRLGKKHRHWQKISINACEQCGLNIPPKIETPSGLTTWLQGSNTDLKLVLHHRHNNHLSNTIAPTDVSLLIGPEGGLTEMEIEQAINAGFQELALGPRVLRTETAPIVALSILQYLWGDLAG